MASNPRHSGILLGKQHPRTSIILSPPKPSTLTRKKPRSLLHDVAHIMLPLVLFTHFIITGTVILVYTIYLDQKLSRNYVIGTSIGFGVLLLLLFAAMVVLRYSGPTGNLGDEESHKTTTTKTTPRPVEPFIERKPRFQLAQLSRKDERPPSELSAEVPASFAAQKGQDIQVPRPSAVRGNSHSNNKSSLPPRPHWHRTSTGLNSNLESVKEGSRETSGSESKVTEKEINPPPPESRRNDFRTKNRAIQTARPSIESLRPVSPISSIFEPSSGSRPALSVITGHSDLNSNDGYRDQVKVPLRTVADLGNYVHATDYPGQSMPFKLPASSKLLAPLFARKLAVDAPPLHDGTDGSPAHSHRPQFKNPWRQGRVGRKESHVTFPADVQNMVTTPGERQTAMKDRLPSVDSRRSEESNLSRPKQPSYHGTDALGRMADERPVSSANQKSGVPLESEHMLEKAVETVPAFVVPKIRGLARLNGRYPKLSIPRKSLNTNVSADSKIKKRGVTREKQDSAKGFEKGEKAMEVGVFDLENFGPRSEIAMRNNQIRKMIEEADRRDERLRDVEREFERAVREQR